MERRTNVKLSKEEYELVQNTAWILTKQSVVEKVVVLFGELSEVYRNLIEDAEIQDTRFHSLLHPEPKISKGEQYEKLPYVMLDFPRVFDKENVFAIRSFFWWGHFFSINLHVSGTYQRTFFSKKHQLEKFNDWSVCVNDDPWQHHFREKNFRFLSEVNSERMINHSFIKLAKKIPLSEWNLSESFFRNHFSQIMINLTA